MTNNKKQLYRTIVKSLSFVGLIILSYFLLRSALLPPTPQKIQIIKPVTVDLTTIREGSIKIIRWNHSNIAILHRPKEMQQKLKKSGENIKYFVFNNAGGDINCPLSINQTTKITLKDICSGYLYDGLGKVIKQNTKVQNLIIPPHHFIGQNTLIVGEEKTD